MWIAALFSGKNGTLIRTLVIGSIVITIIIVLYFVFKKKAASNAVDKFNQDKISEMESEIVIDKISYPLSEFNNMADKIYNAHHWYNDSETAVYEVFQRMQTNSDVLKLQQVFGIRDDYDLFGYCRNFLDDDELAKVNSFLAQRNISIKL